MTSVNQGRACLVALIFLASLSCSMAQSAPATRESARPQQKVATDTRSYVTRCVEELDLAACEHAEKLPLSTKEKSQVLTYKRAAQLLCEDKTPLDQAIWLDTQNALAYFLRARCSATNAEEAVNSYRKAIELRPEWKRYYVDVALLANGLESYKSSDEGLKIWQLALESAPDDPRVYPGYASALGSRGKNAEAEAMLKRGTATISSDADSAYGLCSMYIAQKDLTKLRPVCETAIAGLSSEALGTLGYQLSEIKEYALAEAAYRKAVERGPDPGNVSESNLANTLLQEGKAGAAAEIYRRRLAKDPTDSENREQYAVALEAAGDMKKAEAEYLKTAQHKDCDTLSGLGRFYLHQKKVQQAFEAFDQAFQAQWDCPTPVYFLTQEPGRLVQSKSKYRNSKTRYWPERGQGPTRNTLARGIALRIWRTISDGTKMQFQRIAKALTSIPSKPFRSAGLDGLCTMRDGIAKRSPLLKKPRSGSRAI
jgi:tetratricopeptide (TPR) repeat protein